MGWEKTPIISHLPSPKDVVPYPKVLSIMQAMGYDPEKGFKKEGKGITRPIQLEKILPKIGLVANVNAPMGDINGFQEKFQHIPSQKSQYDLVATNHPTPDVPPHFE